MPYDKNHGYRVKKFLIVCIFAILSFAAWKVWKFIEYDRITNEYAWNTACSEFSKVNIFIFTQKNFTKVTDHTYLTAENIETIVKSRLDEMFEDNALPKFSENPSLYRFYFREHVLTHAGKFYKDTDLLDSKTLSIFITVYKRAALNAENGFITIGLYRNLPVQFMPEIMVGNQMRTVVVPPGSTEGQEKEILSKALQYASCHRVGVN